MMESLHFQIEHEAAGQRLDEFLAGRLGHLSRLRLAQLLAQGACTVNHSAARAGQRVMSGDIVELVLEESAPGAMTPEAIRLAISYEDEHLLVVVKPAGMLVHPTRGVKTGTLANALTYHLNRGLIEESGAGLTELEKADSQTSDLKSALSNLRAVVRPGIVHRLDYATSGLMLIAKHQRALSILSRHFHERRIVKRYLALVWGRVAEDERHISAPIGRDCEARPHWRVMADGKQAETRLRVLERRGGVTLVELEPVTGRTNQLRIHCAHLSHPIIGDQWYGTESAGERLCLHAARLAFHHPAGGRWMEFASPLPSEIAAVLSAEPGEEMMK
jgi:23S rRNA pseudouridine1911/1915/1917 synthase